MLIKVTLSEDELTLIRHSLSASSALSREHLHMDQAQMFYDLMCKIPDPNNPAKPELPLINTLQEGHVTKIELGSSVEYKCRACGIGGYKTHEDAADCTHPEKERAQRVVDLLEYTKEENWEYKVKALKMHYIDK